MIALMVFGSRSKSLAAPAIVNRHTMPSLFFAFWTKKLKRML